ncbi:MAG: response regulator [Lachnospiraceae bacterium]|nr:response regulator [Lachnospiraceae bacterium]
MTNDKMKKMAIKVNGILSRAILLFLFLVPVICVLQVVGISEFPMNEIIFAIALIVVLCIVPGVFNKISYNEELIATVVLVAMEILFILVSLNPYTELAVIYMIVPVVSLFYCNQRLTQRVCLLCYLGMVFACCYRAVALDGCKFIIGNDSTVYLVLLKFTLEYILLAAIVCYGAGFFEGLVLENRDIEELNGEIAAISGKEMSGGKQHLLQECSYDVESLFHGIEKDMLAIIKGKQKSFEVEIDPNLPVRLFGAKEEIRRALSGVCSDLLMYHAEASVKIYVTYDDGIVPKKNQNITLIIKVSGYTDITAVTVNKAALGYYLSQRIIKQLKGSFEDFSNSEQASFRICLLQRVEDERTIKKREELHKQELKRVQRESQGTGSVFLGANRIKALVVDDNKENRKLIDAILNSMGVQVVCTDNGASAIELLESQEYQLVFLDQMMPEKSGIETLKELRYLKDDYYQTLPIILMTVNTKEEAKKEYGELGFTDCISKPINVNEVKSSLRKWIKDDYPLTYTEYVKMQEIENEQ